MCHIRDVEGSQHWRGNVALSICIVSDGNSTAITPDKHCMLPTCRNLGVRHSLIQRRDVALSICIVSDGNSTAITPDKHCMIVTWRNLSVWHSLIQRWDVTFSKWFISDGNSTAITSEQHCMIVTWRNLSVCHSLMQRWDVTFPIFSESDCNSIAIAPEKHGMTSACRNHRWNQGQFCSKAVWCVGDQHAAMLAMLINNYIICEKGSKFGTPTWNGLFKMMTKIPWFHWTLGFDPTRWTFSRLISYWLVMSHTQLRLVLCSGIWVVDVSTR